MSDSDWTSRIAGERMTVDREFRDRVEASSFSNQQWGLVMTAVEFEIENPDDPDTARVVANTSNLPSIMPELDRVENQTGMGGAPERESSGGALSSLLNVLGLGGGGDDSEAQIAEAEQLTQEYADELQTAIESNGRWESICEQAQG